MAVVTACREVLLLRRTLKQKQAEQNKKEAKLYGNMFARLSKLEAKESKVNVMPSGRTSTPRERIRDCRPACLVHVVVRQWS